MGCPFCHSKQTEDVTVTLDRANSAARHYFAHELWRFQPFCCWFPPYFAADFSPLSSTDIAVKCCCKDHKWSTMDFWLIVPLIDHVENSGKTCQEKTGGWGKSKTSSKQGGHLFVMLDPSLAQQKRSLLFKDQMQATGDRNKNVCFCPAASFV